MRQTPGFTADNSLRKSQGDYAAKGSDQLERVVAPAQLYSLNIGRGPRFVWSNEGCPPGQRRVYIEGYVRDKYCEWNGRLVRCGQEIVPPSWECQYPLFQVIS